MKEIGEIIGSVVAMLMWIALAWLSRKQQQRKEPRRQEELESQSHAPQSLPSPRPERSDVAKPQSRQRLRASDLPSPKETESEVLAYAIQGQSDATRRREAALARLGLDPSSNLTPRQISRRGMLWAEVLGPPRAHRGPHR